MPFFVHMYIFERSVCRIYCCNQNAVISYSSVALSKFAGAQPVRTYSSPCNGILCLITMFARSNHWSLFWMSLHSTLYHSHPALLHSHLHLGLPRGHFLRVLRPKFCTHSSYLTCTLLPLPSPFSFISSSY